MAAKVPMFGAWEGGENYTVYFDNARKTRSNGAMINPNDPEENPDIFPQNGTPDQAPLTLRGAESQGQQSKVPQFGAWDNGDNDGYTAYFETARKTKNIGPSKTEKEPHLNQDMKHRDEPIAQTHSGPQETQSKVPQFGAWEGEDQVAYTAVFDNIRKTKGGSAETEETSDVPKLNRDVTPSNEPPAQEARSKVPQFGAWNGKEDVQYTAYFDNARKNRAEPVEPQLNRDIGERAKPHSAATKARSEENMDQGGTRSKSDQRSSREDGQLRNASQGSTGSERRGRQTPGGQSPLHSKGGKPQSKPGGRGSQTPERGTTIPPFGVWNNAPNQGEGFTGTFIRAREDRMTPLGNNTPVSYNNQPTQYPNQKEKKGCCCPWF